VDEPYVDEWLVGQASSDCLDALVGLQAEAAFGGQVRLLEHGRRLSREELEQIVAVPCVSWWAR